MLFANANLFVDGRFPHGAFRGENGRLTDISAYAAASAAEAEESDVHPLLVLLGQIECYVVFVKLLLVDE